MNFESNWGPCSHILRHKVSAEKPGILWKTVHEIAFFRHTYRHNNGAIAPIDINDDSNLLPVSVL